MRLQLVVFSIILVAWLIERQAKGLANPGRPDESIDMLWDALASYALLAGVCLLSFVSGKPALWVQWVAWGVIATQVIARLLWEFKQQQLMRAARMAKVGLLLALWISQLPFLMLAPQ